MTSARTQRFVLILTRPDDNIKRVSFHGTQGTAEDAARRIAREQKAITPVLPKEYFWTDYSVAQIVTRGKVKP